MRTFGTILGMSWALVLIPAVTDTRAQDEQQAPDVWISSLAWENESDIVGTHSSGLPLRPAHVVRSDSASPAELEEIGTQESSLWTVLPVAEGGLIVTDYKGGVFLHQGDKVDRFECDARWIRATATSPNADEILAGTEDGKLLVLSLSEKKEKKRIEAHASAIFDVTFNHAGDKVAVSAGDGKIKIYSWPELVELASLSRSDEAVWSVVFSNDDSQLIAGGADRRIHLWDVASGRSLLTIATTGDWITSLEPLTGTTLVVAGCLDGSVHIVDYASLQSVVQLDKLQSGVWSVALSPDGSKLALGTRKHGIVVVSTAGWQSAAEEAAKAALAERPPRPKS